MRTTLLSALALCLLLGPGAWAGEKQAEKKPLVQVRDREPATDTEVLTRALGREMGEINIADLAVKKASSEEVRKLARKISEDHGKAKDQLMEEAKNLKIGVVGGLDKEHRAKVAKLAVLTGKDFDDAFLDHVIESHTACCDSYDRWQKGAKSDGIGKTLRTARDNMKEHLATAKRLRGTEKKTER